MRCTWIPMTHNFALLWQISTKILIIENVYLQLVDGPQTNIQPEANFAAVPLCRTPVCSVLSCVLCVPPGSAASRWRPTGVTESECARHASPSERGCACGLFNRGDFGSSSAVSFSTASSIWLTCTGNLIFIRELLSVQKDVGGPQRL